MTRTVRVAMPVALVVAMMVAALALWAWNGGPTGGIKDNVGIKGLIEYKVFDSAGNLKYSNVIHNTKTDNLTNAARARLGVAGTTLGAENVNMFSSLRGCSNAATTTLCEAPNLLTTVNNPINADGAAGGTGVYTVAGTFTATGAAAFATLQLTDRNATDGSRLVGAYQTVSITLASGDTLQVTWTITIS